MNIDGPLPNAIFTLFPSSIMTILRASGIPTECYFLCKKFARVSSEFKRNKLVFKSGGLTIELNDGQVFSKGCNLRGRAGVGSTAPWITTRTWIRLPPALGLWYGFGSWFVKTTHGVYAWGDNRVGKLGIASRDWAVISPHRVRLDRPEAVVDIRSYDHMTLIQDGQGWIGCGFNDLQAMQRLTEEEGTCTEDLPVLQRYGVGHSNHTAPMRLETAAHVLDIHCNLMSVFVWSIDGLHACGLNNRGQLGVGNEDPEVAEACPVVLPVAHRTAIHRIITGWFVTFFFTGETCYAVGRNTTGQLGLGFTGPDVRVPTPLPFPVAAIGTHAGATVIRSGRALLVCGNNSSRQLSASPADVIARPVPLDLPAPVSAVIIGPDALFIRRQADGGWLARGRNEEGQLGVGLSIDIVADWTPIALDRPVEAIGCMDEDWKGCLFLADDGVYGAGVDDGQRFGPGAVDGRFISPTKIVTCFVDNCRPLPLITMED